MNKNDKNNKLDILSKILLVMIVLSFVFSAVALGRSCSVNIAAADTHEPPFLSETNYEFDLDYVVPDVYDFDDISGNVAFTYNSIDIYELYVWCTTAVDIYFSQSSWEISISIVPTDDIYPPSMVIYASDIDNFSEYIFDGGFHSFINGYPVFSVGDILSVLYGLGNNVNVGTTMTVYQSYRTAQPFRDGLYSASYELLEPVLPYPIAPNVESLFDTFNGATVTYTIKQTVSPYEEFYSVTVPLEVYPNSSYISLENLYNRLPSEVLNLDFNSFASDSNSNVKYEYVEDFYITLNSTIDMDLHLLSITGLDLSSNGVGLTVYTPDNVAQGSFRAVVSNYGFISLLDIADYSLGVSSFKFGYNFYYTNDNQYIWYSPYRDYLKSFKLVYGDLYSQGYYSGIEYSEVKYKDTLLSVENEAFERGRIRGAAEANNYTFFGLISAVVDAPIQAVTGLLNFEFLGINLFAFFTGLLTVALILFIVKKIMGG